MTTDPTLIDATRAAFADLVDEAPLAPEWERASGQIVTIRMDEAPRRRGVWIAVVAATAAALLLVGGVPWLLGNLGDNEPATDQPPAPTLADTTVPATPTTQAAPTTIGRIPTTTVPATVVAPIPDITWRRVDVLGRPVPVNEQLIESAGYGAMSVVDSGLIIVGVIQDPENRESDDQRIAVWHSGDGGETWEEIDPEGLAEQDFWRYLPAVAAAPSGTFVVAGSDADDAWVWTTSDLETWTKSDSADLGGSAFQDIYDIVHFGGRFIAVGEDGMDAAMWTSPDGLEWSQVLDDDFSAELIGDATIASVASGGPGLIAVGTAHQAGMQAAADGEQKDVGAIWVSSDGLEWDLLPFVDDPGGFGSVSVDPDSGRIIVFGDDTWVSEDGYEWDWYDRTVPFGGPAPGASAAWIGDTAVAGGPDAAFSLWISGDGGITWNRVDPSHPEFEGCTGIRDIIAIGDRFIAVGPTAEDCWADEWTAAVWIGTANDGT